MVPASAIARTASVEGATAFEFAERLLAGVVLLMCMPGLVFAGGAIWALSGRSPLLGHLRVGRVGSPFWVWKLRTMWEDAGTPRTAGRGWVEFVIDELGPDRKSPTDSRTRHPLARFCRRFSLDELPQLWNVVVGEMSLVGPRPLTHTEMDRYYGSDAAEVLGAKPGLTGLWQVEGRNRLTYAERRAKDLYLVRHAGPALYLKILCRTAPVVLRGEGY